MLGQAPLDLSFQNTGSTADLQASDVIKCEFSQCLAVSMLEGHSVQPFPSRSQSRQVKRVPGEDSGQAEPSGLTPCKVAVPKPAWAGAAPASQGVDGLPPTPLGSRAPSVMDTSRTQSQPGCKSSSARLCANASPL